MSIIFIFKGILIKASGHSFKVFFLLLLFFWKSNIQIVGFLKVGYICLKEQGKQGAIMPGKGGESPLAAL